MWLKGDFWFVCFFAAHLMQAESKKYVGCMLKSAILIISIIAFFIIHSKRKVWELHMTHLWESLSLSWGRINHRQRRKRRWFACREPWFAMNDTPWRKTKETINAKTKQIEIDHFLPNNLWIADQNRSDWIGFQERQTLTTHKYRKFLGFKLNDSPLKFLFAISPLAH